MIQRVHVRHVDWYPSPAHEKDRFPVMCASRRGVQFSPAVAYVVLHDALRRAGTP